VSCVLLHAKNNWAISSELYVKLIIRQPKNWKMNRRSYFIHNKTGNVL